MGIVLEATDLHLRRRVAVKLLARERAHSEEGRERFVREARAAGRLSSEHVTHLLDVGALADGTPFLVMEFLVGSTLGQILEQHGPPPVDVVVDWMLQALHGVAEAHRHGLVHRDLKPDNLFLCERPAQPPIVKVLDFGVVKDLGSFSADKLTRTGATMGSPAYMPPEQVRAQEIDQRADVWAIGVTLYELTTGRLPFGGESVPQTLAEILREEPLPLRAHRPEAPRDLELLVTRALSKDRAGRYASATELLTALAKVRTKMPRTSRVTKTVNLGRQWGTRPIEVPPSSGSWRAPLASSIDDPYADTTDMRTSLDATDSNIVQPRTALGEHGPSPMSPGPAPARRSVAPLFLGAIATAVVAGTVCAFALSRAHPWRARHVPISTSATAGPSASASTAPVPATSSSAAPR